MAAAVALGLPLGAAHLLNHHLSSVMYPSGPRTLAGEALIRLSSVHGAVFVVEMAAGQLWRFVLDGWGVAGLGLAAAVVVIFGRTARTDARIMATLGVGVTLVTAIASPAALPPTQPQAWASGRYLDGMVVAFFLVGVTVLLRGAPRRVLICAACVVPPTLLAAIVVLAYTSGSVPTSGFGAAFVFAEPAVLTQSWTTAGVLLATVVALGLLAAAVGVMLLASRRGGPWTWLGPIVVLAGLGAVSLVASVQMTGHISQASTPGQERTVTAVVTGTGLKPGQHLAIGTGLSWQIWMPQAYEVWWTPLQFFNATLGVSPPPDATVVEVTWPTGLPATMSWAQGPAEGWRIVFEDPIDGWVAWRR